MSAVANTICCTWINSFGEVDTQLLDLTEQVPWLKKSTPSAGSFFDVFDFDWFGSGDIGFKVHSEGWEVFCS